MAQKAKPGEPTLLELISQGKVRTSEDFSQLSESEIFSEWVLPAVTGATAETEDYEPGALDLALTIPVVGGSVKTGFKLAKEAAKKIGSAYKKSVRPRVFPEKDALLRANEHHDEFMRQSDELLRQIRNVETSPTEISQAYQRGTYARQAEDAIPVNLSGSNIDNVANDILNESAGNFPVTREQSIAIAEDIGIEGWDQFTRELRTLNVTEGRAFVDNFMAKYKDVGVISGDKALQVYKSKGFKFNVERGNKEFKWVDPKRGTDHSLKQVDLGSGSTMYELKIKRIKKPGDPKYSLSGNPSASLNFHVDKVVDDVYGEIHEIGHMSYFSQGKKRGEIYAGRLVTDLLDRLPENTVINEASMTFDSFYMMINQAVKKKASIVFDEGKRINISPSSRGKWSNDIRKAQTVSERDKVIDDIFKLVRSKLKDYPKLEGRPKLTAEGVDIEFNKIKIHNITAAVAVALGLKNKEQLEKLLAHDPESVESQVFDNDFSI